MHSAEFPERKTKSDADSVDFGGRKKMDIQISFLSSITRSGFWILERFLTEPDWQLSTVQWGRSLSAIIGLLVQFYIY